MITIGSKLPDHEFTFITPEGKVTRTSAEIFGGKRIVLFAVPGAFTPTCSNAHLPGYVVKADQFAAGGVDEICCLSVNDAFVMRAWQREQNAEAITMLADGDGTFVSQLGLAKETGAFGGLRAQRFALIAEDGVVTALRVEAPGKFEVSDAGSMLTLL
ncbi:peroxiredoxin [Aeromonas diversa]|uniref:Glutathione-dependent peroxiredoxin n=1 Tax=Aeromonas diversa CDC 2478-85 TaxID=1268237 RepID=N9VQE6_9GAMM|nr:redoxin family protein [Aeromonas diversa]ENY73561.1 peroxiredoxin [Aeromonas diversa CDC 2478-85]